MRNYGHDQVTSWQQAVRQTAEVKVVKSEKQQPLKLEKIEVESGLMKWLRRFSSRAER